VSGSVPVIPFFQARSPISVTPTPLLEIAVKVFKVLPVVVLLAAGWSCANAAADFVTYKRKTLFLGDATPLQTVEFTLPSGVNRSASSSNNAVLDLDAQGVLFPFNEMYINPLSTATCADNDNDATNEPASIGFLREHADDKLQSEWAVNHIAFSSTLLKDNETNILMICARNSTGDSSAGNLDDFAIRSIVFHYHTTP
jgi:hypothetical protein